MSVGPLRRLAGALGLLALAPTAAMLIVSFITPGEAARRAIVTVAVVLVLARLTGWWLGLLAGSFEGTPPAPEPESGRRATDRPPQAQEPVQHR